MEHSELMELIAQYQSNGGSLSAVMNDVNALISAGKTPLGLNQWQSSDKPVMKDFNEDNFLIDKYLSRLMEEMTTKAAAEKTGTWTPVIKAGEQVLRPGQVFATYVKTDNLCTLFFASNNMPPITDPGAIIITGIPFPVLNSYATGPVIATASTTIMVRVTTKEVELMVGAGFKAASKKDGTFDSIRFSVTYQIK